MNTNKNAKKKYYYYLRKSTSDSLKTIRRLIERGSLCPHEIIAIRGTFTQKRWYRLTILTASKRYQFVGIGWFFWGTGPRGLEQILKWLLVSPDIIQHVTNFSLHGASDHPNSFFINYDPYHTSIL